MFPHDRQVPEKLLKELTGIMIHAGIGEYSSPAAYLRSGLSVTQMI